MRLAFSLQLSLHAMWHGRARQEKPQKRAAAAGSYATSVPSLPFGFFSPAALHLHRSATQSHQLLLLLLICGVRSKRSVAAICNLAYS